MQQDVRIPHAGNALLRRTYFTWTSTAQNGTHWMHQGEEKFHIYDWDGNDRAAIAFTHFFYESAYGTPIRAEERSSNTWTGNRGLT